MILDRIPTRSNLVARNVLPPGEPRGCAFCEHGDETASHLFLHCEVVSLIWRKIMDWLGINFINRHNLFSHFACWSDVTAPRRFMKPFCLIWHTSIWTIWRERNSRIFKNQTKTFDVLVDDVKALSWCWALSRLRIASCLFYEWCWNPRECLKRKR